MRMFATPEGDAGFALKGDDIVSVFKHPSAPYRNVTRSMLDLATDQGGRRLDAFDTVLPTLYSQSGFRAVARTPFNDQYKPEGWDYDQFKNHNKGRPDVVFMVHDPQAGLYSPWDGRTVSEYEHGAVEQDHALNQIRKRGNVPAAPGPESYGSGQLIRLGGQAPTTIWHGTPHEFKPTYANPLGEFDLSKIGTGEGNQSYVYGPYAAGNEKVAADYQNTLSGGTVTYKGQPSPGLNYKDAEGAAVSKIAEYMRDHDITAEQAVDQVRQQYADSHAKWLQNRLPDRDTPAARANQRRAEFHREIADAAERMDPNDFVHDKGNLYEAELHIHPDHMLDWDQDIERQSPYIQERLRDVVEPWKHLGGLTGEFVHAMMTGSPLRRDIDKVGAAKELLRRGIPGVRYADQHSRKYVQEAYDIRRNAPTSPLSMDESERLAREAESRITHNYVVLDPRTVNIVRRNGLPAMVAAGADALRDHKRSGG